MRFDGQRARGAKFGQTANYLKRKGILVAPASAFLPEGNFSHRLVRWARNLRILPERAATYFLPHNAYSEAIIMTNFKVFILMLPLLFLSPKIFAQAVTEYGKVVGGVGRRQGNVNPKASRASKQAGKDKGVVQGMADVAPVRLPSALTVESKDAALYHRHDEFSDKLADVSQGERLIPVAETTAGNTHWYMVKTQTGLVGWVKSTDIKKEGNPPGGK